MGESYFTWLTRETPTAWWHDSGDPVELDAALAEGATGVTTNPVLTYRALIARPDFWAPRLPDLDVLSPQQRAERLIEGVVSYTTTRLQFVYEASKGAQGYVCAQVNPALAADREPMLAMARRFAAWAPNVAIKLPVTAAGLDVLEELVAEGITVTATVSFTVPQVLAVAERHRAGARRARQAGVTPGRAFAVIMIGRLDDYLRDVAHDARADVSESDIRQAGLAVTKRAYHLYQERSYEARLLVAALRGTYHMTELAGADLIMSIHPRYQAMLLQPDVPQEMGIEAPVPAKVTARLLSIDEFVRAYEPEGMAPEAFIRFGATQRTLSQFIEAGWAPLETFSF
jgi:transaldolase